MSAVVYDVGYETRMIKKRKKHVWFLAAIKEFLFARPRLPKKYQDFEAQHHI